MTGYVPIPVVRLYTEPYWPETSEDSQGQRSLPVVSLRFDYGGSLLKPHTTSLEWGAPDAQDSKLLSRNLTVERSAQRRLEGLGAVELGCMDECPLPLDTQADYLFGESHTDAVVNLHSLCSFTAGIKALATEGWRVEIAPEYPYQVIEPSASWYAHVDTGESADWFSFELGISCSEGRIDLLPALLELLESHARGTSLEQIVSVSARFRALPTGDGRYAVIPAERLRVILGVLSELYGEHRYTGTSFQFPAILAEALRGLDAGLTPSTHPFIWRGDALPLLQRHGIEHRLASERVALDPELKATLRSYQELGVCWLTRLVEHQTGGILADDMGLGKTLMCIAHIAGLKHRGELDRPALIIMPTSLVGNWRRELYKFAPHLSLAVVHGARRALAFRRVEQVDIVLSTYPILVREKKRFSELAFSLVILDEAQAIKNKSSQATAAARGLRATHRLCLTGTPIENHLGELWVLFDFLMPGFLGSEQAFRRHFRQPIEGDHNETRLELLRRRVGPYILRRTKADVLSELPPKTELLNPVFLAGAQRDLYEGIRVAAHTQVRQVIRQRGFTCSTIAILDALMKLRQVCCDPRLVNVPSARNVHESAKFQHLMHLLEQLRRDGHRALVFSQFTQMLALIALGLEERGVEYSQLTGASVCREQIVERFERGHGDVFLISLKAGGTGLNLTSADTVIHYDPWWNPAAQAQASDRAYRMGQKRPVFVHNLVVAGSVEERMLALQEKKQRLAQAVLGHDPQTSMALSEADVEDLFAPLDAAD